jgi:hypothetical protein
LNPLLDPNSPKYLFSKSVVDSYLVPPKAAIAQGADKVREAAGKQTAAGKIKPAPPTQGEVRNGYKYTGGKDSDPADQANWEKI